MFKRKPDLIVGPSDNPYMLRWHILKLFGYQLALHKICRSDDDRALHDHRAWNVSIVLKGGYCEITRQRVVVPDPIFGTVFRYMLLGRDRKPGMIIFRRAATPHRLVVNQPSWSIWLRGPATREWGFHCPGKGWIHWKIFCNEQDYSKPGSSSTIGKGCD